MKRKKLREKLYWLEAHPEKHTQSCWTNINGYYDDDEEWADFKEKVEEGEIINCGTTGCLAGWIGLLDAPVGTKFYESRLLLPDTNPNEKILYSSYAGFNYGLTTAEATYLFDGSRSRRSQMALVNRGKKKRREFLSKFYNSNGRYTQEVLDRLLDTKVQLTD